MINSWIANDFFSRRAIQPIVPPITAIPKKIFNHPGVDSYNSLCASESAAKASWEIKTSIKKFITPDKFHNSAITLIIQNEVVGLVCVVTVMRLKVKVTNRF